MAIEKFVQTLLVFTFYNHVVAGSEQCTPPWLPLNGPFLKRIKFLNGNVWLNTLFSCPFILGDQKKEYCCYDSNGNVECCDFQDYFVFRFLCLLPIIIIVLVASAVVGCIICFACPGCFIYNRRQNIRTR